MPDLHAAAGPSKSGLKSHLNRLLQREYDADGLDLRKVSTCRQRVHAAKATLDSAEEGLKKQLAARRAELRALERQLGDRRDFDAEMREQGNTHPTAPTRALVTKEYDVLLAYTLQQFRNARSYMSQAHRDDLHRRPAT